MENTGHYTFSHEDNFSGYEGNAQKLEYLKAEYQDILERLDGLERQGHPVSVPDNGQKAVEAAPHIGMPGDDINFRVTGQCA